ncbi:MAG: hypothetical protein ACREFQ_06320 [Stellaceae bacterium]
MRRFVRSAVLAAAILAAAGPPAASAMLGDATVPYRAMRTVTIDGRSYVGSVESEPGHQRHEQSLFGLDEVFLLDTRAASGILMLPSVHTYIEFALPPLMAELSAPDLFRHPLGTETIAGVATTKYRIDHTAHDGSRAKGYLWVSSSRILMKFDLAVTRAHGGRPMAISMALSALKTGPVDPELFRLPQGLVRLPPDALGPLLGGRPG